ncbi:macrophage migration inhibitory factor homolog [Chenopodium quinoa]|uniref:macrophage migration inhibitory factor homolog n=1 Tax=Chenopodium quinoa TaxID=63459 RepID=UPI000B782E7C|nr:macrophage migration inhibitory factor homolog [Chenopodium quinoa]
MPALYITTNVNLEGVDVEPIFSEASAAIASIIGRPQHLVMVVVKGSVPISFTGTKDPAAFAQLISMGGINKVVKKNLITSLGAILQNHLTIPPARFFCHVIDTTAGRPQSKL